MKKSNKKGIWIPKFILDDEKLNAANKIIYAEIISLAKLENGCYASDEHFGQLVSLTRTTALKRISKLVKLGYLIKKTVPGKGKHLFLKEPIDKSPVQKGTPPCSIEVDKDVHLRTLTSSPENTINTYNNTDIIKQELVQENIDQSSLSKAPVCTVMTQGQSARARIKKLEELIIEIAKSGREILGNAKYLNEKRLWEYVESKSEYEKVMPLWKELVYVQNALYGK